jgi:serine phosphatase RsbU (regulator of sigma subunit)
VPDEVIYPQAADHEEGLSLFEALRFRLAAMHMRPMVIWRQIRSLAGWLESRVLPEVRKAGHSVASLEVHADGEFQVLGPPNPRDSLRLGECEELCEFLLSLGVRRLALEPRLESNQVSDILMLLYVHRRELTADSADRRRSKWMAGLFSPEGVRFACTVSRISGEALSITYSYCRTRFSWIVQWFERRNRNFADHRALFNVAPYYAIVPAAIALGTFVIYTFHASWWVLLVLTVFEALVLAASVYLFFMIVGSVEYDNEEKSYRLRKAYAELRRYADRTREDLALARSVQEKLLPDQEGMPLPGAIEWASLFEPETEVGGDYYDAAELPGGKVAILFADVSGHGMAAALITAILKGAFQTWIDEGDGPAGFVRLANHDLRLFTPEGEFAALVAAVYDHTSRCLTYVNCGHGPEPIRIPGDPREPIAWLSGGRCMVLGVLDDVEIEVTQQQLAPGDTILLATDGLTEAVSAQGVMYRRERMYACLQASRARPLQEMVDGLIGDVRRFSKGIEPTDDRTVLAFLTR